MASRSALSPHIPDHPCTPSFHLRNSPNGLEYPLYAVLLEPTPGNYQVVDKQHYLDLLAQDSTWLQRRRDRYDLQSSRDQISLKRYDSDKEVILSVEELLNEGKAKSGANGLPFFYLPPEHSTTLKEVTYYLHDHLGNMRVTYSIPCVDGTQVPTLLHAADYYPYGSILRQHINGAQEKYLTTHHERDQETGLDYRGARYYDSDVARFLSLDPLAVQRASQSPYNYVSGNPISRTDPDGRLDGWVEDAEGNVSWDARTNSAKEFKANYTDKGKNGFKYVSYADNANSYTLPTGEGRLVMNAWDGPSIVVDGSGGVEIDMTFIPGTDNKGGGWTQTYMSNITDVHDGTLYTALPEQNTSERLDGTGVQQTSDVSKARYFDGDGPIGTPNNSMWDRPMRAFNEGAQISVHFHAQSTFLLNGQRAVSVGWGFSVTSKSRQRVSPPTILKSTTDFHNRAVNSLLLKLK